MFMPRVSTGLVHSHVLVMLVIPEVVYTVKVCHFIVTGVSITFIDISLM